MHTSRPAPPAGFLPVIATPSGATLRQPPQPDAARHGGLSGPIDGLPELRPAAPTDGLRRLHNGTFRCAGAAAGICLPALALPGPRQPRSGASGNYRGMTAQDMLREAGRGAAAVGPDDGISPALRLPGYRVQLRDMAAAFIEATDRAGELADFQRALAALAGPFHALHLRVAEIHARRPDLRTALQDWARRLADILVERALQPARHAPIAPELELALDRQIAALEAVAVAGTPLDRFGRRLDAFFQDIVRPGSTLLEGASGERVRGGGDWLGRGQLWLHCSERMLPGVLFHMPAGRLQRQWTAADLLPGCSTGRTFRTAFPQASGIDRIKWYDPQGWIRGVLVTDAPGGGHRFSTDAGQSWRPVRGTELPGMQAQRIRRWGRFLGDRRQGA